MWTRLQPWPHAGVELPGGGGSLSYAAWAQRLRASFDRCYYVPLDPAEDVLHGLGDSSGEGRFVSVRGMFRDTVGSAGGWPDFQLRPSVLVAMAVAPGLFDPAHAAAALEVRGGGERGDERVGGGRGAPAHPPLPRRPSSAASSGGSTSWA